MESARRVEDRDVFQEAISKLAIACEAGDSVKPGVSAPGRVAFKDASPRSGRQPHVALIITPRFNSGAVARFAGSVVSSDASMGLAPQALCCRPLRGLITKHQAHFAIGNTGSISTGTFFNLSSACCIGGRITANLSRIALAFSYEPSASSVSRSCVSFVTPALNFS